jgi:hypothetical protein
MGSVSVASDGGVGDEVPVDGVGDLAPERPQGCFVRPVLGDAPIEVGAAVAVGGGAGRSLRVLVPLLSERGGEAPAGTLFAWNPGLRHSSPISPAASEVARLYSPTEGAGIGEKETTSSSLCSIAWVDQRLNVH